MILLAEPASVTPTVLIRPRCLSTTLKSLSLGVKDTSTLSKTPRECFYELYLSVFSKIEVKTKK